MINLPDIQPPQWATCLLARYCKPELLEDLQGDLYEYFERNVKEKGIRRAKLIYIIDVIKFFRLYIIRKPEFINLLITWIMLGSYIKTSGRSIVRNKLFSFINIVGLAVSMSVGLLLIGVLTDTFSYDKFNVNHARIYRVISRYEYLGNKDNNFMATTSLKAGRLIQETFSAPEAVAILRRDFSGDVKADEKIIPLQGFWANVDLCKVLSFEMIAGNQASALKEPFSIVLTQTAAKKLFGSEDVLGKSVTLNNDKQYTITGILKDIPKFSHVTFDMLGSLSTRSVGINQEDEVWDNVWNTWVYLLLPEKADVSSIKIALNDLSRKEDPSVKDTHIELALQPLDEIMIGDSMGNEIGPVLGSTLLWVFGGLALVVLLSACFNYTNLSIARALRRTREVGIRKVIGANKGHVITQFITEAIIISICALSFALLLFFILRPHFLTIEPEIQKIFSLQLTPMLMLYFMVFAITVGIAAGLFPALFFAHMQVLHVLKNTSTAGIFKGLNLRKTLIIIQYSISIILVTSSIGIYRQYRHFIAFDLGFNTKNILNISLQGNRTEILKKELNELPEVKAISESAMVTSVGSYWGTTVKYTLHPLDSAGVAMNYIDENYLALHEHTLVAGKNFEFKPDSAIESEVIVSEKTLKRFNIADQHPEKALGEILRVDGKNLRIIGVVKDFQYGRANNRVNNGGVILRYNKANNLVLNVKLQSTDLLATYAKVESIWKKIDSVHPLDAHFYDEQIDEAFSGLKAAVKLAGFLAFLAISIASLGLLGMVVFTTEIRLKEVSIRKVMGASEAGLLFLLGKGFLVLLLISALIGLTITVLLFEKVVFINVVNSAPINIVEMLVGVFVIMLLALVMILTQTLKVANTNPAEILKNE